MKTKVNLTNKDLDTICKCLVKVAYHEEVKMTADVKKAAAATYRKIWDAITKT